MCLVIEMNLLFTSLLLLRLRLYFLSPVNSRKKSADKRIFQNYPLSKLLKKNEQAHSEKQAVKLQYIVFYKVSGAEVSVGELTLY